jgi:hypothetical protein
MTLANVCFAATRSIRHSLLAVVPLLVVAVVVVALSPLAGEGQGQVPSVRAPRKFYLTRMAHDGNEALAACAAGYHMASLWEIFDPTQLRYDTALGLVQDDSGSGPPSGFGWIHTGVEARFVSNTLGGPVNCGGWTSDNGALHEGTAVGLTSAWHNSAGSSLAPWEATIAACSEPVRVWCVQD